MNGKSGAEQYPESRREEIDYFWIFPTILKISVGWSKKVNQNLFNALFHREREGYIDRARCSC